MRSTLLTTLSLVAALLAGCVKPTGNYCDIAGPLYFGSDATVEYLLENDKEFLRGVVTSNEIWQDQCQ